MNLVFGGIVLILLGLLPGGLMLISLRRMRKNPQVSREYVSVPANDRMIRIVRPQIESRYEYRLSGVVVVGDNKPDHTFDFYLLHDMETLALYEQGKEMPYKKYQHAKHVVDWRTYMQTGPGLDFALVFINRHLYDLSIHIKLDYYPHPFLLRGAAGSIMSLSTIAGVLVSLAGIILTVVGFVQWLL